MSVAIFVFIQKIATTKIYIVANHALNFSRWI